MSGFSSKAVLKAYLRSGCRARRRGRVTHGGGISTRFARRGAALPENKSVMKKLMEVFGEAFFKRLRKTSSFRKKQP
ncbi:hypothetical protein [Komagataeibacter xylinus]|uniref:hypothetical protein n=1 Tax=Komagataeibacter xylinus TaxID=28448 RepID=UPI0011B54EAC|nr:hypothetical protein [Komagataeibacter xylinus]